TTRRRTTRSSPRTGGRPVANVFTDPKYADKVALRPFPMLGHKPEHIETVDSGTKLYEVKPKFRVVKTELKKGQEKGIEEFAQSGATLAYFLPYEQNKSFRTTLKSEDPKVDPEFFFTIELNGCSVFVDGAPTAPNVYHLNANNVGGQLDLEMIPQNQSKIDAIVKAKVDNMEKRYVAARKNFPPDANAMGSARMIDMTHYMGPQIKVKEYDALMKKLQKELKLDPEAAPVEDVTPALPLVEFYATVFGLCDKKTEFW